MEIGKRVYYCRLRKYSNLANVIDMNQWGIYLERVEPGCLRLYYTEGGEATAEERIKWWLSPWIGLIEQWISTFEMTGTFGALRKRLFQSKGYKKSQHQTLASHFDISMLNIQVTEHSMTRCWERTYESEAFRLSVPSQNNQYYSNMTAVKTRMTSNVG